MLFKLFYLTLTLVEPDEILVDKGNEFYNRPMKSQSQDNVIHSTHNEGKSVAAERLIETLKNKIQKCVTSITENVYIDKLEDIID